MEKVTYFRPILDVKTRWNSTYDMLERAFELKPALNHLCKVNKELVHLEVTKEEWELLERVAVMLENFKEMSTKLGGDKYVTLPSVIYSTFGDLAVNFEFYPQFDFTPLKLFLRFFSINVPKKLA